MHRQIYTSLWGSCLQWRFPVRQELLVQDPEWVDGQPRGEDQGESPEIMTSRLCKVQMNFHRVRVT